MLALQDTAHDKLFSFFCSSSQGWFRIWRNKWFAFKQHFSFRRIIHEGKADGWFASLSRCFLLFIYSIDLMWRRQEILFNFISSNFLFSAKLFFRCFLSRQILHISELYLFISLSVHTDVGRCCSSFHPLPLDTHRTMITLNIRLRSFTSCVCINCVLMLSDKWEGRRKARIFGKDK